MWSGSARTFPSSRVLRGLWEVLALGSGFREHDLHDHRHQEPHVVDAGCSSTSQLFAVGQRCRFCRIQLHLDAEPLKSPPFTPCLPSNSFNNAFGICAGSSEGTNGWTTPKASIGDGIFTALAWCDLGICTYKGERIALYAGLVVPFGLPGQIALIAATVPSAGSNQFKVVWAKQWPMDPNPRLYWATGNSGPPGTAGGPLLLNYQVGLLGSDVYLDGFLERKTMSSTPPGLGRVDPLIQRLTTALEQGTTSGDGPLLHSLFDLIQP